MALGRAARARPRGGDRVQTLRQSDARLAAAAAAVALLVVLAIASGLSAGAAPVAAVGVGALGATLAALGAVLRRGFLVTAGLAFAGSGYALSLVGKGLDPSAGLFAAGLLAAAELAYWAVEPGAAVRLGREATARRALLSGVLVLATAVLGTGLVEVVADPVEGGAVLGILGVAAITALVAVLAALTHVRRPRRRVG